MKTTTSIWKKAGNYLKRVFLQTEPDESSVTVDELLKKTYETTTPFSYFFFFVFSILIGGCNGGLLSKNLFLLAIHFLLTIILIVFFVYVFTESISICNRRKGVKEFMIPSTFYYHRWTRWPFIFTIILFEVIWFVFAPLLLKKTSFFLVNVIIIIAVYALIFIRHNRKQPEESTTDQEESL